MLWIGPSWTSWLPCWQSNQGAERLGHICFYFEQFTVHYCLTDIDVSNNLFIGSNTIFLDQRIIILFTSNVSANSSWAQPLPSMAKNFGHSSPRIEQWATQQRCANEATNLQENPLRLIINSYINSYIHFPLSGRFYDVERVITRRKRGSESLVLFLIRHVLSLESACSPHRLICTEW